MSGNPNRFSQAFGFFLKFCKLLVKNHIFTRHFFASFGGCIAGMIIATMPLFLSIMHIDLNPIKGVGQKVIDLILWSFDYANLVYLVNETLLAGIALGVSGAITWYESSIDGKLGKLAAFFAAMAILGVIAALVLFIGILREQVLIKPDIINEDFVKYVKAAYIVTFGLIISYFSSILQVRRVKDLARLKNG